jgi:hypothetical protein
MSKRNHCLAVLALSMLAVVTLTCGPGEGDTEGKTAAVPTPTQAIVPTRTQAIVPTATVPRVTAVPTHTPVPVQTPQEDALLDELFEEAYFIGCGGGSNPCWDWLSEQQPELPAVGLAHSMVGSDDDMVICLLGFPFDEQITVSFYAPDGDLLVSGDFITDRGTAFQIHPGDVWEEVGWAETSDDAHVDIISIRVAWLAILPAEGYIRAISASAYAEGSFDVGLPRVSVLPTSWENSADIFGSTGRFPLWTGDEAVIAGAGFEPEKSVPLGVYLERSTYYPEESGRLLLSEIVTTDDEGNFYMLIQIEPSDPAGYYCVLVVITAPEGEHCFHGDVFDGMNCYAGPITCFTVEEPG